MVRITKTFQFDSFFFFGARSVGNIPELVDVFVSTSAAYNWLSILESEFTGTPTLVDSINDRSAEGLMSVFTCGDTT